MTSCRLAVEHAAHGPGLLLTTPLQCGSGLPVVVRFRQGLRAVAREELTLADGSAWPGLPPAYRPEPLSPAQRQASRWLEALRLGTVGSSRGDAFTVGRQAEIALIQADLRQVSQRGGACRVFCGAYGSGKSHLLELAARQSLAQGAMAVSRVVLDRQRVSAHRPRRLYREIVNGLTLPNSGGADCLGHEPGLPSPGVATLARILDLAAAGQVGMAGQDPLERHPYFSPLLAVWPRLASNSAGRRELLYWVAGGERQTNRQLRQLVRRESGSDPGPLYAIKDHRTVWNQLTSLLTGLSCLIRQTGLAQGLVLVVDEAEMCALPSALDQRYGDRTLTGLCAAALGQRAVRRPELLRQAGGHQASRDFPAFHRSRSHLYLVLAMASRAGGREVLRQLLPGEIFVQLSPLSQGQAAQLIERIVAVYRQAFPHFELGGGLAAPLVRLLQLKGLDSPRQIVQQTLAFLDGARLWPGSIELFLEECLSGL